MVFTILLTGCTNQEYKLSVNDDGTCVMNFEVSVNTEVYNLLSSYDVDTAELNRKKKNDYGNVLDDVDALFQELASIYHKYGYEIEVVNDAVKIGFSATKIYSNTDEINKEIKELKKMGLTGLDFEITAQSSELKKEYTVYGTLDYILDPDIDMENSIIKDNFPTLFDTSILTAQAQITMPSETQISATDGEPDENTVTWKALYNEETTQVHVISSYKNKSLYVIIMVVAIVVILAIVFAVLKFKKKNAGRKNEDFYDNSDTDQT